MTDRSAAAPDRGSRPWLSLLAFFAAVIVVALVGSLGVGGAGEEYARLSKPGWAPPSWLFGPVWTVLYALVAVAGWLVWRRVGPSAAIAVYAVQLLLNALWTPLFFGLGRYGVALVDIVVLWVLVGVTTALFWRVRPLAGALLLPYWAWVSFATALNFAIWRLN